MGKSLWVTIMISSDLVVSSLYNLVLSCEVNDFTSLLFCCTWWFLEYVRNILSPILFLPLQIKVPVWIFWVENHCSESHHVSIFGSDHIVNIFVSFESMTFPWRGETFLLHSIHTNEVFIHQPWGSYRYDLDMSSNWPFICVF